MTNTPYQSPAHRTLMASITAESVLECAGTRYVNPKVVSLRYVTCQSAETGRPTTLKAGEFTVVEPTEPAGEYVVHQLDHGAVKVTLDGAIVATFTGYSRPARMPLAFSANAVASVNGRYVGMVYGSHNVGSIVRPHYPAALDAAKAAHA